MFEKTKYLSTVFSVLILSACGGDGGTTQKSTDVSYTSASALGGNVNHATAEDSSPEISSNGLELFFHSDRDGQFDIWVSVRASEMDAWEAATKLGTVVNSTSNDKAPTISDDGLTLIFTSDRVTGSKGNKDLWMSTRTTLNDPWTTMDNIGDVINTAFDEAGPDLSSDGLSLFFHSTRDPGLTNLYVSIRPSIADPWEAPSSLGATINSDVYDNAPEISSDGLSLYFHSTRTGGSGTHNIWVTTRTRVSNSWNTPTLVPDPVDSIYVDTSPGLSDDWQTLYFASTNIDGNSDGDKDIWQAVP